MLNLGDITFGLGANTAGIQKGIDAVERLNKVVRDTVLSHEQGWMRTTQALLRQKDAANEVLNQTLKLQSAMRQAGAPIGLIGQATQVYQRMAASVAGATLTQHQLAAAQNRAAAGLQSVSTQFNAWQHTMNAASGSTSKFNVFLRDLQGATILAVGPLSGFGARVAALAGITSRSTLALAALLGGITGLVVGFSTLARSTIETSRSYNALLASLQAASGSTTIANAEFEFIAESSRRLGLDLGKTAEEYGRLAAATANTVLSGEKTRQLFLASAEASTALGLSAQQTQRMLLAFTQIAGKGRVSAQEVIQQLGEVMPAVRLFSEALGMTQQDFLKAMESGTLLASNVLPKVAARMREVYGEAAVSASKNVQAAINRVHTEQFLFNLKLDQAMGLSSTYRDILDTVSGTLRILGDNLSTVAGIVGALSIGLAGLFTPALLAGAGAFIGLLGRLALGTALFGAALNAIPGAALLRALTAIGLAAVGAVAGFNLFKNSIEEASATTDTMIKDIDKFIASAEKQGGAFKGVTDIMVAEVQKRLEILKAELEAHEKISTTLQKQQTQKHPGASALEGLLNLLGLGGDADAKAKAMDATIKELVSTIATLEDRLKALQDIKTLDAVEQLTEKGKEAEKKIKELNTELLAFRDAVSLRGQGTAAMNEILDLHEAGKLLKDLPSEDLAILSETLRLMGFEADTTTAALAKLIRANKETEESLKEWQKRLDATPKALADIAHEIDVMYAKAAALDKGPKAFKEFEDLTKQQEAIRKLREELDKTALSQDEINDSIRAFEEAQKVVGEAQKRYESLKETLDIVEKSIDQSFDRIGEAITEAFLKGQQSAITFSNVVNAILSEVMQTILKITLLQPLKAGVTGLLEGIFSTPGKSPTGPTINSPVTPPGVVATATGAAFASGIRLLAGGGLTNGPEIFPSRSGMNIMGEAGTEGVFPLMRDSHGRLGVIANGAGGGTPVVVNVYNNSDSKAAVEKRESAAGTTIDVFIDKAVARKIRSGGDTRRAILETLNVHQQLATR